MYSLKADKAFLYMSITSHRLPAHITTVSEGRQEKRCQVCPLICEVASGAANALIDLFRHPVYNEYIVCRKGLLLMDGFKVELLHNDCDLRDK